jgi:hypothetical protein
LDGFQRPVLVEDLQARAGGCARQRISRIAVTVKEGLIFSVIPEKSSVDLVGYHRRRKRKIAARKSFCQSHEIRPNIFVLARKHLSCSTEACGHFVANEKNAVLPADLFKSPEKSFWMNDHTGSALNQRFHDKGCYLLTSILSQGTESVQTHISAFVRRHLRVTKRERGRNREGLKKERPIDAMKKVNSPQAYRPYGVTMI